MEIGGLDDSEAYGALRAITTQLRSRNYQPALA